MSTEVDDSSIPERSISVPVQDIDGGWGWIVVFSTFMIRLIADGVMYTFGIFYSEFLRFFGESTSATALVVSMLLGISYFVGPAASALTNRYGCRKVSISGSILVCLGFLLSLAVPRLQYLYLTIGILAGAGFSLIYVPCVVSVSFYFEKKRATAVGISSTGSGIGALAFAPLLKWLIDLYYWQGAMLIVSGLILNCIVFSLLYRPINKDASKRETIEVFARQIVSPEEEISRKSSADAERQEPKRYVLGYNRQTVSVAQDEKVFRKIASMSSDSDPVAQHAGVPKTPDDPGTLYQPDAFYSGSLSSDSSVEVKAAAQKAPRTTPGLPKEIGDVFRDMLDLSLMKNPVFMTFTFGNFLTYIGLHVPFVFTNERALEFDLITLQEGSYLLSILGVSNTVGRFSFGLLADHIPFKRLYIFNACLTVIGVSTVMSSLATEYYHLALYCVVFGAMHGSISSLTVIVLVELMGISKLNNSFGLLLLCQGVAVSVGSPITGWLHDQTGSYDSGFYFSGGLITLSSFILCLIPVVQRYCQ